MRQIRISSVNSADPGFLKHFFKNRLQVFLISLKKTSGNKPQFQHRTVINTGAVFKKFQVSRGQGSLHYQGNIVNRLPAELQVVFNLSFPSDKRGESRHGLQRQIRAPLIVPNSPQKMCLTFCGVIKTCLRGF